jgi:hypothetical protein
MDVKLTFDQAEVRIHRREAWTILDRGRSLGLDDGEALALLKSHSIVTGPILKEWWKRWKEGGKP